MSKLKKQPRKKTTKSPPPYLKAGDTVEIIAPGSSTAFEKIEKGAAVLKSWGLNVIWNQDILNPKIFLSNTDKYRFDSFKKAMNNPKSQAVWCLRGGYGSIRLLPMIEKMPKIRNKILIGLSDITSLQTVLANKWDMASLHTSLIDRLADNRIPEKNLEELKNALFNPDFQMEFSNLRPLNKAGKNGKTVKSKVVGGNLMVVTSTLGTPSQLKTKNKIVFLEELCERAYRVDRCLQQMKQAGLFREAAGVIFGDFTDCHEANNENHIEKVLREFCEELKIPAFMGLENGHGELQRPLFFNTEASLTCKENGRLTVDSPFKK
ncbi:MAG: S66 peptidase family protein [Pseudobdellovibrio sp.]